MILRLRNTEPQGGGGVGGWVRLRTPNAIESGAPQARSRERLNFFAAGLA